jgi:hypothetical protein
VSWGIGGEVHNFIEEAVLVFSETGKALYIYNLQLDIAPDDPLTPDDMPSLLGRDIIDRWRTFYNPGRNRLTFGVLSADVTITLGS